MIFFDGSELQDFKNNEEEKKSSGLFANVYEKLPVYDKFKELNTKVYTIVGNHDVYYKNTNEVNAVDSLLESYDNIVRYTGASEVDIDGFKTLLLPWICQDNYEESITAIKNTKSKAD